MLLMLSTFSVNGIGLPFSSQLCSTLELAVMCRCAWACLITFEPGIFANVSAALRAAADKPIRVARLSSASTVKHAPGRGGAWLRTGEGDRKKKAQMIEPKPLS